MSPRTVRQYARKAEMTPMAGSGGGQWPPKNSIDFSSKDGIQLLDFNLRLSVHSLIPRMAASYRPAELVKKVTTDIKSLGLALLSVSPVNSISLVTPLAPIQYLTGIHPKQKALGAHFDRFTPSTQKRLVAHLLDADRSGFEGLHSWIATSGMWALIECITSVNPARYSKADQTVLDLYKQDLFHSNRRETWPALADHIKTRLANNQPVTISSGWFQWTTGHLIRLAIKPSRNPGSVELVVYDMSDSKNISDVGFLHPKSYVISKQDLVEILPQFLKALRKRNAHLDPRKPIGLREFLNHLPSHFPQFHEVADKTSLIPQAHGYCSIDCQWAYLGASLSESGYRQFAEDTYWLLRGYIESRKHLKIFETDLHKGHRRVPHSKFLPDIAMVDIETLSSGET